MNERSAKHGSTILARAIHAQHATARNWPGSLGGALRLFGVILFLAGKKFLRIDGSQWAGAFAFNAFFSLFPLMILLVTVTSGLVDRERAGKEVVAYMESYIPMSGAMRGQVLETVAGVIRAREKAGFFALLVLVWVALQCFTTLICATNRAWGTPVFNWWRLPLRSLGLLGITAGAVLLGMAVPVLFRMARNWILPSQDFRSWVYDAGGIVVPLLVVFLGLSLFYRLAPRRPTRFAEVWAAALCATLLLRAGEGLFVIYLRDFATLNAVYGAFGGMMALLLWIYYSGCVFIIGACLSSARSEMLSRRPGTAAARAVG